MKITKSKKENDYLKQQKIIANIGCDICPECKTPYKGFGFMKIWCKGLFKMKYYRVDCYTCINCGCEWESEKYEW